MTFLLKNPPLEDSQRYHVLRQLGQQKIEELAHELWTDYNIHDPGITLLELLCFAITDLGYRTGYEMKDLLTSSENGIPRINANFHTALNIFPNCPVTFKDLRKCLIDIEGVRNAWISKHQSIQYCLDGKNKRLKDQCDPAPALDELCEPLNGLYDVLLEYEDTVEEQRIVLLGELIRDELAGGYIVPASEGLAFRVFHDSVLKQVSVYSDATGEVTVNLWRRETDGSFLKILEKKGAVTLVDTKTNVELDFELRGGYDYILRAEGTAIALYKNDNGNYPDAIAHLIELRTGHDGANAAAADYFFFYDWELSYGLSQSSIQTAWGGLPDASTGTSMNANNQGLLFTTHGPIRLQSVDIFPFATGELTICLFDEAQQLLQLKKLNITTANAIQSIALDWDIPTGANYRLLASGLPLSQENLPGLAATPLDIAAQVSITNGVSSTGSLNNRFHYFYNWVVRYRPAPLSGSGRTRADVRLEASDKLLQIRNLCEDIVKIRDLEFEHIAVCADIELRPEAPIEETLARIYFELENYIAPPVNFYTIAELLAKGKTTDEIFEGPVLEHGFIDHEEFCAQERRCFFRSSDIIQIIMDVPGVTAVKEISLLSFIEITDEMQPGPNDQVETLQGVKYIVKQAPWILELADPQRFTPDLNPLRSKFMFYKNDLPYIANMTRVMDIFADIRATHIRPKLKGHERDLPVPLGEFKDLERYFPAQNALPPNYQVGAYRVPDSATPLRKAQARQLKGYLLFFEQHLANYLSQLGHVSELFSWKKTPDIQSYFTQRITGIAQVEELYFDYGQLPTQLRRIIETPQVAAERKNRFLDHLMGRFAESFAEYALHLSGVMGDQAPARLIEDKQDFLEDYPLISSARGKGFDYRYPHELPNITGLQRRIYRLLGIRPVARRNFSGDRFAIRAIDVVEDGETLEKFQFVLHDPKDEAQLLLTSIPCEGRDEICALLDASLHLGADSANWQLDGGVWVLFQRCGDELEEIARLSSGDGALLAQVVAYFQQIAQAEGFHVVEHLLLRKRTLEDPFLPVEIPEDECDCPCVKDPYSFRASVILPSWAGRFRHIRFRQMVERMLREEAPAHIYLKICWINHCEMRDFEQCHDEWLHGLAELNECYRGQMPLSSVADLPVLEKPKMEHYSQILQQLIDKLHDLTNVFPTARLHDCETVSGDEPQISLNNTSLGSL